MHQRTNKLPTRIHTSNTPSSSTLFQTRKRTDKRTIRKHNATNGNSHRNGSSTRNAIPNTMVHHSISTSNRSHSNASNKKIN